MAIWVLTSEINEYDQAGEYYVWAWDHKPSHREVAKKIAEADGLASADFLATRCLVNGGGRINAEYRWFNLFRQGAKRGGS